ncbi:caspase recruitment domain-containing protein 14 isoform X2 [Polypterus senegalus]|uniref:caspase recruitment domain-containing protein 14 isoform X2 n=1 Tax=Polypterus senegalus TaxID=55291 RepID=UPI001963E708|nr:caspase recruitment domain-containing protein 14 isoform X2 [Polypterus senegalus]
MAGIDMSGKELKDLEEDDLWEMIDSHRHKIVMEVQACLLIPYLRQAKVLIDIDEEEILYSLQLQHRCTRNSHMLDLLKTRGKNGAIAFLESVMIHYPRLYSQVTGKEPIIEAGSFSGLIKISELTEYLVKAISGMQSVLNRERHTSSELRRRCLELKAQLSKAREAQDLEAELSNLRRDFNTCYQEIQRLKDEKCTLFMRYTRSIEENSIMASRCRDLQLEVQQLKYELKTAKTETEFERQKSLKLQKKDELQEQKEEIERLRCRLKELEESALAIKENPDQSLGKSVETRQELMVQIHSLQEFVEEAKTEHEQYSEEKEAVILECQKLRLDCEMYQEKLASFQMQLLDLQKERDQAYLARDEAQCHISQGLLEKDSLRLQLMELQEQNFRLRKQLEQLNQRQESSESDGNPAKGAECRRPPLRRMAAVCPTSPQSSIGSFESFTSLNEQDTYSFSSYQSYLTRPPRQADQEDEDPVLSSSATDSGSEFEMVPEVKSPVQPQPPYSRDNSNPGIGVFLFSRKPAMRVPSQVTIIAFSADKLLRQIEIVGGNESGIFVHSVTQGSHADQVGLKPGSQILAVEYELQKKTMKAVLQEATLEEARWVLKQVQGFCWLSIRPNMKVYQSFLSRLETKAVTSGDSFYIRVNMEMETGVGMRVKCNDILHITDTLFRGEGHWKASHVNPCNMRDLDSGAIPNYYRAQMLLIKAIEDMALQLSPSKKPDKTAKRKVVRIVSTGRTQRIPLWLSNSLEESSEGSNPSQDGQWPLQGYCVTLMPYTLVTAHRPPALRPVLILPNIIFQIIYAKLEKNPMFTLCKPENLSGTDYAERQKAKDILAVKGIHGYYSCYTKQAVESAIAKKMHSLLDLELDSVSHLHKAEIFPIVVFVGTSEKNAKRLKSKLQKHGYSEDQLLESSRTTETLLDKLSCLSSIVTPESWSTTESLANCIESAVSAEQRKIVWIEQDIH